MRRIIIIKMQTFHPRSILSRLSSPRKVIGIVCGGLTCLTVARVVVLLVESYSAVRSERAADRELMHMCEKGTASLSVDFRTLCMKKRAEQSAPILLKALLRACATAFTDFCESMSSPVRVVLLLLFCVTGVAAPVVKACATLFVDQLKRRRRGSRGRLRNGRMGYTSDTSSGDDDHDSDNECSMIVVSPTTPSAMHTATTPRLRLTNGLRRGMRQIQRRACGRPMSAAGLTTPAMLQGRLELDEEGEW